MKVIDCIPPAQTVGFETTQLLANQERTGKLGRQKLEYRLIGFL
jgi:hypothetical protein